MTKLELSLSGFSESVQSCLSLGATTVSKLSPLDGGRGERGVEY